MVRDSLWRAVSHDPVFRGCTGKRAYTSRAAAQIAADILVKDGYPEAHTYRCTHATHFHVSSHRARPGRVA